MLTSGLLQRSKKDYNLVKSYYVPMKSSISAKIPTELYVEVQGAIKEKKYTSNTECIIEGLNLLLRNPEQENTEDKDLLQEKEKEIQNLQNEVNRSKGEIQVLQEEVKRSKEEVKRSKEDYINQIKSLEEKLRTAPDPVELAKVQAHLEGINRLLEEKEERIKNLNREVEGLHKEVERLDMFAHYFKSVEVKQIEAPAPEKVKPWYKFW